jgi:hypothetical protein
MEQQITKRRKPLNGEKNGAYSTIYENHKTGECGISWEISLVEEKFPWIFNIAVNRFIIPQYFISIIFNNI